MGAGEMKQRSGWDDGRLLSLVDPEEELGIRVEQVFVGNGRTEMEEAEFLIGWERTHRHSFPGPCLPLMGLREFLSAHPKILMRAPGRSGLRLRLSPQRELGLQAQKILYLFLKYPEITYTKAKFSHLYEMAFGDYVDAAEAVGRFGGLLEWKMGMYGQEVGLREGIAWSLRARYLLLYHEYPLPVTKFAEAYRVRYSEELPNLVRRLGFASLQELLAVHSHVISLTPAGLSINPVFLASLARVKSDIIFPVGPAGCPRLPLPPPPQSVKAELLRVGPPRKPIPDSPPPLAPPSMPPPTVLPPPPAMIPPLGTLDTGSCDGHWEEEAGGEGKDRELWAAANPVAACLCHQIGVAWGVRRYRMSTGDSSAITGGLFASYPPFFAFQS